MLPVVGDVKDGASPEMAGLKIASIASSNKHHQLFKRRSRISTPQSTSNTTHGLRSADVDARDVAKHHLMQYEISFDTVSDEDS